jgi:tetratricopeptide (TPR) repeat protein
MEACHKYFGIAAVQHQSPKQYPLPVPRFIIFDYLAEMKGFLQVLFTTILFIASAGQLYSQSSEVSPEEKARAIEYFIQGISDFENEDYERALDNLTAAHLKLSDDPGINYALSDVYLVMGDYSNAAYYGRLAANADPENMWYHLRLADIYRRSGLMEATLQALENSLEHHPNNVDILYMKATIHTEFGDLHQSNEVYRRIREQNAPVDELLLWLDKQLKN